MKKEFEFECITTYNKQIYDSKNPNLECLKLIEKNKYTPQKIYSLKLSKSELSKFLLPNQLIEWLYRLDKDFNDLYKISMCIYGVVDNSELPYWYNQCNGKIVEFETFVKVVKDRMKLGFDKWMKYE